MKFVKNAWYAAAWSEEIGRELFQRKMLNEPVLLYRTEDGCAIAMSDYCPHRFAPLHLGKLVGDTVECPYHGLQFDCTGKCVDNPHGDGAIPKAAHVRTYLVEERYGLVWVWMGNPAMADVSKIADYSCLTDTSKFKAVHGYIKLNANYQLVMDNLTDLSHASFVHETTLEPRETAKHKFHVTEENGTIFTRQWCANNPITPLFKAALGMDGPVDHWLEMRFIPPANMMTYYGITRPGATREEGWDTHNPNIITPETETTTHYFWGTARTFDLENEQLTAMFREGARNAFENEDRPMLESQQALIGSTDLMTLKPVLLVNDAGSVRVRRMLKRMIDEEATQPEVIPIASVSPT
ncbi:MULTISPECIES: aromatic ring-hydroxylating dioxygenase subunit alpha [unclassified Burkholderia]|uniref:aromatic ring-hydroxylating dioxygenase subunit alpha n=1 Tax=unclassified Burkholderia TaxID=2613784 RepID=UPI002AB1B10C|nr:MULTISPECIES: aromatic ring-hydroxylating dioxygenase subunit alpha [unclassified Burkholderia]